MKKKLQVFVSSTYIDLQEEREAAVEAILGSKHIPAGMELFRAGNNSQLVTIKKWIDESDVYMLILGGRYGSIEPESGKSYTQLEYEYALKKDMPIFAVVLKDNFLFAKAAKQGDVVREDVGNTKFEEFKTLVMSKMIKEVEDCKDIKLAIKDSIAELEEEYDLMGWVRATEVEDNSEVLKKNLQLSKENVDLTKKNVRLEADLVKLKNQIKLKVDEFSIIKKKLSKENITVEIDDKGEKKEVEINCLDGFKKFSKDYSLGIDNELGMSEYNKILYFKLAPEYIKLGLLDIKKIKGPIRLIELSNFGKDFLRYLAKEDV